MGKLMKKIFKSNIYKNGLLRNILAVSILLVITLPLYDYLVIRPSFDKFLTESTSDEAVKIAKHFVAMFFPQKTELDKNTIEYYVPANIENFKNNFE